MAQGGGYWAWLGDIVELGLWGCHVPCIASNFQCTKLVGVGAQELGGAELTYLWAETLCFCWETRFSNSRNFTSCWASNDVSRAHIQAYLSLGLLAFVVL